LPYDLVDANGQVLQKNAHLLSLKDLNQSDHLEALLDAGVSSLKIEGRLKDVSYVKNVVSLIVKNSTRFSIEGLSLPVLHRASAKLHSRPILPKASIADSPIIFRMVGSTILFRRNHPNLSVNILEPLNLSGEIRW
jgi:hypothetical protein